MKYCKNILIFLTLISSIFANDSLIIKEIMKLNGYKKFDMAGVAEFAGTQAISFNVNYVDPLRDMEDGDIHAYSLDTIPPSISQLKSLRVINIKGNTKLPQLSVSSIFPKMNEIRIISADYEQLPEMIRNMPNLRALSVKLTPVEKIPEWIGDLSKLEFISFEGVPPVAGIVQMQ